MDSCVQYPATSRQFGSDGEIAIAESTVKNHVNSILSKLKVKDRTQAATSALRRGIVMLD